MPGTPVTSPSRPRSALKRLPSYRPLSFSTSKLSLSHVTPDPANRCPLNKTDGSSRIENFCSHPIKSTSSGVRRLLRKASHSLRFTHCNETLGGMKRDKCPGTLGDGESGIVIDDKDNDCFYAIDTTVARKDFVKFLPPEITAHILSFLDHQSLVNCEPVSRAWMVAARDRHVWRNVFRAEHGPWKSKPGNDWKRMFKVRQELNLRWTQGRVTAKYLKGHTDSIYCVQFDDKKIITGSRDKTIRIWDISTGECIRVLGQNSRLSSSPPVANGDIATPHMGSSDYHRASVLCLQFDHEILVSGSSDYTCIVWSVHTYTPLMRLAHHTAGVLDVCFDKKYIVSCSKDTSVCIWDRRTGRLFRQLTGHRGPVNAVAIRGNLIVSASGDALIKLWNVDTGRCIRDFTGHNRGLACVQFSEDARTIVSGGNDQDIRIWDAASGECIRTLAGHQSLVRTLHLDSRNRRIISGSYDQSVKVWDLDSGKLVLDIQRFHSTWILSAKADYRRIISTSQDNRTLMLDFTTGMKDLEVLE
ncbi:WD40 repeat-like protein [Tuber magnatum]|uniref:WD40 repeat-like protein n=1 Tax=Tuber magnatum TaxID=42249 RepID=A0A317SHZ9_9PEZI|nr:WD40 repeat-like protein [Tuber magnatum]